jgi:type IV secretion system protein VirB5
MLSKLLRTSAAGVVAMLAGAPLAHAQWAVIDAPAIVQLVKNLATMEEQLQTARSQLDEARQTWSAMTGGRGMELLLGTTVRNYLPSDWTQISGALGGGGFGGLTADIRALVNANSVLTPQRLLTLSSTAQQQIAAARQWSATQAALSHEALQNVSARFASVQNLISAIGAAGDQKAILDLQARITAELGMLQNEQTKLEVLNQVTQAQQGQLAQQQREAVLQNHGRFETRFQPVP